MTARAMGVDDRAEAYLDGELDREEAAAFERDLASLPEVADALGAALVLRDLLGHLPPSRPPEGLERRILEALPIGRGSGRAATRNREGSERSSPVPPVRAALAGASWLLRPPAAVMHGGRGGARPIAGGLTQLRWVLGPLAASRAERAPASERAGWRRLLGWLGGEG